MSILRLLLSIIVIFVVLAIVLIFVIVVVAVTASFYLLVPFLIRLLEDRSIRLHVLDLGSARLDWKAGACDVEILKLQLFDAGLQCPILLSQLDQLGVNSVNGKVRGRLISCRAAEGGIHVELAVLGITLVHDVLDFVRHHLLIVLPVILQDALNQFQPLPQGLVLDIESEHLRIRVLLLASQLLDLVSQLSIGFEKVRNRVH